MRHHAQVPHIHNLNLNNFLRGQRSLDRFHPQPAGPPITQYDHRISMDERFQILETSHARCSELESQSRSAKTRWNELLSRYHQSQLRYEVDIDPYKGDTTSLAYSSNMSALRKQLARNGRALEAHSTVIRNIERDYEEARTALKMDFNRLRLIIPSNPQSIISNTAYTDTTYATQPDRRISIRGISRPHQCQTQRRITCPIARHFERTTSSGQPM